MWLPTEIPTLPNIASHWAKMTPNKVALSDGRSQVTYKQLESNVNAIANRIVDHGVPRGSHIAYIGSNSIEFFELWLGICTAGCAIAPFNARSAIPELAMLIEDSQTPLIFCEQGECLEKLNTVKAQTNAAFEVVAFNPEQRAEKWLGAWADTAKNDAPPAIDVKPDDIALLVYTSGTTGLPKGVQYDHQAFNYSFLCLHLEPDMRWQPSDVGLMAVPNFHLGGSWVLLPALYNGATIRTIPSFEPQQVLQAIETDGCTIVPLVPTALQMVLAHPQAKTTNFSSLHRVIYFGSPISAAIMKAAVQQFGCKLNQLYGTTETWFATLLDNAEHIGDEPPRLASCGRAITLVDIKICDTNGQEQALGTVGEVCIRTPTINKGYFNKPDATAEAFRDGWYKTGDLGWMDNAGFIFLVDRAKDMIVSGGENIYSVEVERVLNLHPDVVMAAVIAVPDEKWGERVTAFVVPATPATTNEAALCAALDTHCRKHLADYKAPKDIILKTALPLNPTGKIQKNKLREPYWADVQRNI